MERSGSQKIIEAGNVLSMIESTGQVRWMGFGPEIKPDFKRSFGIRKNPSGIVGISFGKLA